MTISEKVLDVEGLPVHYFEAGEDQGRALLLLHGGIGDARANWLDVLPPLAEEFHVFAPDLPGFDGSAALPDTRLEPLIHWLRALLDALELPDAVIVASCSGGLLARFFAAAEPQYVPALILVNGGIIPRFPAPVLSLIRLPLVGGLIRRFFGRAVCSNSTLNRMTHVQRSLPSVSPDRLRSSAPGFAALLRALILPTYPANRTPLVPTLLIWGANDPVMPLAQAEALRAEIPGAVLAPIADCGHMPQLEASEAFVFQVTAFLDHLTRSAAPHQRGVGMLHVG